MKHSWKLIAAMAFLVGSTAQASPDQLPGYDQEKVANGWVALFDGVSSYGWQVKGDVDVKDGKLILGGSNATVAVSSAVGPGEFRGKFSAKGADGISLELCGEKADPNASEANVTGRNKAAHAVKVELKPGSQLTIESAWFKPSLEETLFDGKSLDGWVIDKSNPKRALAEFSLTKEGELHVLGGPGDIRTEKEFADFVLQTQVKTASAKVNSGIFFRCVPGQIQNGYECQIQNAFKDDDRTKPLDWGTGAIYRRVAARKIACNDQEWCTLTIQANGPRLTTWVNGYMAADWVDDRPKHENPRQGLRTDAGHISIQGHNPPMSADLLFREIKIVDLSK